MSIFMVTLINDGLFSRLFSLNLKCPKKWKQLLIFCQKACLSVGYPTCTSQVLLGFIHYSACCGYAWNTPKGTYQARTDQRPSWSCHNAMECLAIKISYKSVKNTRDPNGRWGNGFYTLLVDIWFIFKWKSHFYSYCSSIISNFTHFMQIFRILIANERETYSFKAEQQGKASYFLFNF